MRYVVAAIGVLLVLATFVTLIPTSERWIRIFDFPRVQIAVLLVVALAGHVVYLRQGSWFDIALLVALVAASGWQAYRIYPYTPVASQQVRPAAQADDSACVRLLVVNVLMDNRNAAGLLQIVRQAAPDLLLLVETDAAWDRALRVLSEDYPHSVHQPQDNYYGMILYSKLPLIEPAVAFLVDEHVPSIHSTVELPSGQQFEFSGVHPVPPPLADTARRDAELLLVGKKVAQSRLPVIVAGDLNDVGWSPTTLLFSRISGLLDPRLGRGFYASYDAKNPLLRWPLDHIFHSDDFTLKELKLLDAFGSDHFPVYAQLCHEPQAQLVQEAPPADGDDKEEARDRIIEGLTEEPEPGDYPRPDFEGRGKQQPRP